jgi:Fe-S cluster assembly ATP-binding protein
MTPLFFSPHAELSFQHASVQIGGVTPLRDLSLVLQKSTPTALLGPNGSGKSTLLKCVAGDPDITLSSGGLQLVLPSGESLDWQALTAQERALQGLFMAWQHPPALLGLKQRAFLRTVLNAHRVARGLDTLDPFDFLDMVRPHLARLGLSDAWLDRSVGEGFSGGERKKNELLQLLLLQPEWVLCDELEAGMDLQTLHLTAQILSEHVGRGGGLLVVSHHPQFLDLLPIGRMLRLGQGGVQDDVIGPSLRAWWHAPSSSEDAA